jgi:hypothetical protein
MFIPPLSVCFLDGDDTDRPHRQIHWLGCDEQRRSILPDCTEHKVCDMGDALTCNVLSERLQP